MDGGLFRKTAHKCTVFLIGFVEMEEVADFLPRIFARFWLPMS
jgi:hypothetical protein